MGLPPEPALESRCCDEAVEGHGEFEALLGREERIDVEDAQFSDGRVLSELTSMTPVSLAHDTVRDEILCAFTQTQSVAQKVARQLGLHEDWLGLSPGSQSLPARWSCRLRLWSASEPRVDPSRMSSGEGRREGDEER